MTLKLRKHLSYANVMATIAAFIALGSGAYAAVELPRNSVGTDQIRHSAVNGSKVDNGSLSAIDLSLKARPSLFAASNGGPLLPPPGVTTAIPLKRVGTFPSAENFRPDAHHVYFVFASAKGNPGASATCSAEVQILLNGTPLTSTPVNATLGGSAVAATSLEAGNSATDKITAEITPKELTAGSCVGLRVGRVVVQVLEFPIALY